MNYLITHPRIFKKKRERRKAMPEREREESREEEKEENGEGRCEGKDTFCGRAE